MDKRKATLQRVIFGGLWLGFVVYAFGFAPPDRADTFDLIQRIIQGHTEAINPILVMVFNLMGVLPLIYGCFLIPADHGRKFPAGLIIGLMMGVGAFALLPYLALRPTDRIAMPKLNWWVRLFGSRWLALALAGGAVFLVAQGIGGDWTAYFAQWQQERFVHVMTLDFVVLTALLPVLVRYDLARRHSKGKRWFWVSLVPLAGPLAYLIFRRED